MVKDIKYIIKRVLIGVGIALILMLFKGGLIADVEALSLTAYDSNYRVVGECSNCTTLVPDNLADNIERLYIKYDNTALTSGTKYTLETTYEIISLDQPTWTSYFYISGTNQNIQLKYNAINGSQGNVPIPGGLWGSKYNIGYVGDFTASKSGNGGLLEIYFSNRPYFSQIKILTSSFAYNGDSSIDAINNQTNMIINNQNNNTNQIINNQNNSTNQIINNQNNNTNKEIDSQKVCSMIDKDSIVLTSHLLNSNGVGIASDSSVGVTDYIDITGSTLYQFSGYSSSFSNMCFYNSNKVLISCLNLSTSYDNSYISIPSNATYFRSSIDSNANKPTFKLCKNGNQALNNSINEVGETISDSSVDDPSSDIDSMKNKLASNGVITQLITLPVTLYQSVLNNINGSCSTFNLGSLYNHNLSLPCIQPENYLGSSLWGVIDVLCCGLFILSFRKRMVDIFNHMSSLKDRGNELE